MTSASKCLGAPPTSAAARASPNVTKAKVITGPCNRPRWHSRGYLPHFEHPNLIQTVTFRLHDSLPKRKLKEWDRELTHLPPEDRQQKLRAWIEKFLDSGHGSCWLRDSRIAKIVEDVILHFDGERYHLLAWCIMPNHVHAMIETKPDRDLSDLLHSWKSYSAHQANKLLGRSGAFWQREYFDRFIRDGSHYENAMRYIADNPVKAGLVHSADEWPRSSACWMKREPSRPIR
jgi:putative DNA methylase